MLKIIHARTELGVPLVIDYAETLTEAEVTLSAHYGPVEITAKSRKGWLARTAERIVAELFETERLLQELS